MSSMSFYRVRFCLGTFRSWRLGRDACSHVDRYNQHRAKPTATDAFVLPDLDCTSSVRGPVRSCSSWYQDVHSHGYSHASGTPRSDKSAYFTNRLRTASPLRKNNP